MTASGHASFGAQGRNYETAAEARAREVDSQYFAEHPSESSYVRRAIAGEASLADEDTRTEWSSVEWVLVTVANPERSRRERVPLREAGSVLVDGA